MSAARRPSVRPDRAAATGPASAADRRGAAPATQRPTGRSGADRGTVASGDDRPAGASGADRRSGASPGERRTAASAGLPAPLVWTFDGPLARCLADADDALRRAIVLVGDVARVALILELSLPALQRRVQRGDEVQPGWGRFLQNIERYGLPAAPSVRHVRSEQPLLTLVVAYRN